MHKLLTSSLFLLPLFTLHISKATAATIAASETQNVSALSSSEAVNFTGAGTLDVDEAVAISKTLGAITTTTDGVGAITFSGTDTLVAASIGTSDDGIGAITFNADGILNVQGDLYASSITTATTNTGTLILSGSSAQTVSAPIGASDALLKTVAITSDAGTTFNGDVYATTLGTTADGATISGAGALNFSTSNFNNNTTISSTGTVSLGDVTIGSGSAKTLTADTAITLNDLALDSSSILTINTGNTLTITGSITGTGSVLGDATTEGNVLFAGTEGQSVGANVELGNSSNYLDVISTSNTHTDGLTFNNDVYASALDFANASDSTATISIVSSKTINITGNITEGTGGAGVIKGAGKLNLNGTSAQTIAAALGTSTSDRLGELELNNAAGVTLNDNAYLSILRSSTADSILVVNAILDATTTIITESLTISGTGTINLGAADVANTKTLTLNSNVTLDSLETNTSGTTTLGENVTLTITGDISGSGTVQGSATTRGNILFSGSSAQTINANLGGSSNYLNTLSFSNTAGVNISSDVYASALAFINRSSEITLSLTGSNTLDVTGNITQTSGGSSAITGASATVKLSGSSAQSIYAKIGTNSTRINLLEIDNSAGATLFADAYVTTLTLTSGSVGVAAGKTLNVSTDLNLSGKTFVSGTNGSAFGKIQSGGEITVDTDTTFEFDYSDNAVNLDYSGATKYVVADGTTITVTGDIADVNVTDNSFLFDNSLSVNATTQDIETSISSSANFNESTLGTQNYNIISNALQYSGLSDEIISLSSAADVSEASDSLRPVSNGAATNASLVANNNATNITTLHLRNLNANITGFSAGDETKTSKDRLWAQAFGGGANQSKRKGIDGYKSRIGGIIFGADTLIEADKSDVTLGAAFAYSHTNIDGDSHSNNDSGINAYQIILYNNNADYTGLGFYNNNIFNLSFNDYKTQRKIVVGSYSQVARGDFNGTSYSLKTGLGYRFKLSDKLLISPHASIQYYKLSQDSYTEKGVGNAGLNVDNKDYDDFISELGVELTSRVKTQNYDLTPKFSLSWSRNLQGNDQESTISFIGGGSTLQNNAITPQRNRINLGFGLDVIHSKHQNHSIKLVYDLQLANKYNGHLGSIEYSKSF